MNIEEIAAEAARLYTDYLADPDDHELREKIVQWLGRSEHHRREFVLMVGLKRRVARALQPDLENSKAKVHPLRSIPPGSPAEETPPPVVPRRLVSRRNVLLGGVGAAASVGGVLVVHGLMDRRSEDFIASGHVRRTNVGASIMHAARHSETEIQNRGGTSWVRLIKGLVAFDLSPGAQLIVETSVGTIAATGARFAVSVLNGLVVATVATGSARWTGPAERMSFDLHIDADEEAILRPEGLHPMVTPSADAERKMAWTGGSLIFLGETLGEIVRHFNLFNETQIRVDDNVAHLTIRAHQNYRLNDPEAAARRMAGSLGLNVVKEAGGRVLRITRSGAVSA